MSRLGVWRERLAILRLLSLARLPTVVALTATVLANGAVPAALSVAIGVLVSRSPAAARAGLDSPEGRGLLVAVAMVSLIVVAERILPPALEVLRTQVSREIDGALRARLLLAMERSPQVTHLERPETHDQLSLVKGGLFGTAGGAAVAAVGIVSRYLQTILSVLVIAWFSVPIALFVFVVVVGIRRRWHKAFEDLAGAMIETAGKMRRAQYFSDLVLTPAGAKEVRVFGLLDWLVGRQREYWNDAVDLAFAVRSGLRIRANFELALLLASYLVTTVVAVREATRGELGLGVLAAVLQCQFWAAQLIAPTIEDYATAPGLAALRALREIESSTSEGGRQGNPLPDEAPEREVRFERVSFSYAASPRPVLQDFTLSIEAGTSTAIVGPNGAGKTTLIKLLCGLYQPDEGDILIDGISVSRVDQRSWQSRFGAAFQDFNRYELSAFDNVTFGNPAQAGDELRRDRAAGIAGALRMIESLPRSWETPLSRQYEGGTDLSGGQWQRIALARALFAIETGARVLILDEPTANLDVRAETEIFNQLLEATRGITTVLISHRFSSVRRADRIVVVDGGRLTESGTHDELMAKGGTYARMFVAQAQRFLEERADLT